MWFSNQIYNLGVQVCLTHFISRNAQTFCIVICDKFCEKFYFLIETSVPIKDAFVHGERRVGLTMPWSLGSHEKYFNCVDLSFIMLVFLSNWSFYSDCDKDIYWSDADNVQFLFTIFLIFGEFWLQVIFIAIQNQSNQSDFPPETSIKSVPSTCKIGRKAKSPHKHFSIIISSHGW